jgi:light-regulated signal transduction histidine kinase (bacteriophytochrome)
LDENGQLYLSFIKHSVARSQSMLSGLLELSRISVNPQVQIDCNCSQIVQNVVDTLKGEFTGKPFNVSCPGLPLVIGDKKQLSVLFYQLIKNALVFCNNTADPHISIESDRCDNFWTFSVQDNGIGIEEGHAEAIFDVFRKLHTDEEYPGLGLGLTLSRKVVKSHGGSIHLKSLGTEGACMLFTLPTRSIA